MPARKYRDKTISKAPFEFRCEDQFNLFLDSETAEDVRRYAPEQEIGRRSGARRWVKESGNEFFEKGAEVYAKA